MIVAIDLILHAILFVIQLSLFSLGYITAVVASIRLFLLTDGLVFTGKLTVVSTQIPSVGGELIVQIIVSSQHFCTARMVLGKAATTTVSARAVLANLAVEVIFFTVELPLLTVRRVVQTVIVVLALLVGISRMYLLEHFLTDVYFGSLLGMGITAAFYLTFGESDFYRNLKWKDKALLQ